MGARRRRVNQFLPPNLYRTSNGYYQYRDKRTGKYHSLGKDKAKAIRQAQTLNAIIEPQLEAQATHILETAIREESSVTRVRRSASITVKKLIDEYIEKRVPQKNWSKGSLNNYLGYFNRYQREFGREPVSKITVRFLSDWMEDNLTDSAYVQHRVRLNDIFAYAASRGYCKDNQAALLLVKKQGKSKRRRLTVQQFWAIHAKAPQWMQIAMEIGLITLQRGVDIRAMKYDHIKEYPDGSQRIEVAQQKTRDRSEAAFLAIRVTPALQESIARSRDGIKSPFIVHHRFTRHAKDKEHWTQVLKKYFTDTFLEARAATGLFDGVPDEELPGFHQIRALGIHLYEKRHGKDYAQALAGHEDPKMTELYAAGHEVSYTPVDADLDLVTLEK